MTTPVEQTPPEPAEGQQPNAGAPDLDTPKFTQRQYNNFEARTRKDYQERRARDEELISKGQEYERLLANSKPLEERVESLSSEGAQKDARIGSLEGENLRLRLAGKAGLHPDLWTYVQGNTEDEINAHIETLRKFTPAGENTGTQQQGGVTPNQQQGRPSGNEGATGSLAAGRDLWQKRHGSRQLT